MAIGSSRQKIATSPRLWVIGEARRRELIDESVDDLHTGKLGAANQRREPRYCQLEACISRIMAGMISRIFVMALALASVLLAADPTGTWTGDQPGQNGNTYTITFKLKADGRKLTGTMGGDQFEQPIQNGEIHGDDISFAVHLDFGNGIDLKYTGKVGADQIDFKVMRGGESTAQSFVAKKAK
jgi:hypothetical protein